jgi:hypothetical protein
MLRLLERDPHGQRLRDLLARFRTQELLLDATLQHVQAELEAGHRESGRARGDGAAADHAALVRCAALQLECDLLATEIVHVRLAIAGTCEELHEHDQRRFVAARALLTPA